MDVSLSADPHAALRALCRQAFRARLAGESSTQCDELDQQVRSAFAAAPALGLEEQRRLLDEERRRTEDARAVAEWILPSVAARSETPVTSPVLAAPAASENRRRAYDPSGAETPSVTALLDAMLSPAPTRPLQSPP